MSRELYVVGQHVFLPDISFCLMKPSLRGAADKVIMDENCIPNMAKHVDNCEVDN